MFGRVEPLAGVMTTERGRAQEKCEVRKIWRPEARRMMASAGCGERKPDCGVPSREWAPFGREQRAILEKKPVVVTRILSD